MRMYILVHVDNIPSKLPMRGTWIAFGAVLLTLIPVIFSPRWFVTLENRVMDLVARTLPPPTPDETVRIVAIDDRAVAEIGQWPWSRSVLADGILSIGEFSPRAMLLDIELSEASPFLIDRDEVARIMAEGEERLDREQVAAILTDRDTYLSAAIRSSGVPTFVPLTIEEDDRVRGALPAIRAAAVGEGFSNLLIDPDGVSRRVETVMHGVGGPHYQLALALHRHLAPARVESTMERVPYEEDAPPLFVRWPRRSLEESYPHLSWATLIEYQRALSDLQFNLELLVGEGLITRSLTTTVETLRSLRRARREALSGGDTARYNEYRSLNRAFFALTEGVLAGGSEAELIGALEEFSASGVSDEVRAQLEFRREEIRSVFAATEGVYREVKRLREFLLEQLSDAVVMVGYTATSTFDLGVTPYDEAFPNVGVHAAVYSMVSGGDFLFVAPPWVALLIGTAWVVIAVVTLSSRSGFPLVYRAIPIIVLPIAGVVVVLHAWRWYLPFVSAVGPAGITTGAFLWRDYARALTDRRTIKSAFEHYLSPAVINELTSHPERLGVQGQERELTTVFTDIEGFSRASELMDTQTVVGLLNEYLTAMSDVIIDQHGTIDKYEGDAIMAFFGAPIESDNHAVDACHAAIQMKRVEVALNERLVRDQRTTRALKTRIGINTGEVIVGNLGTSRRLNYTVMGRAVNLASRLEGINKLYGTHVCISEATYRRISEEFLVRRMDRVRVQGIDTPVRIFELVGYTAEASSPQREALEIFSRGLAAFEEREWERAQAHFETLLRIYPDDGPSQLFIKRCLRFLSVPPRETWDGVIAIGRK